MLYMQLQVKALPRVCMKNTARGEAECCITMRHPQVLCFIHTSIGSALNGILFLTTVN